MSYLDKLRLARTDLATVLDLHDLAVQRLRDQQRGQPGSGLGGGGSRGSSSPVESALGLNGPGEHGGIRGDSAAHKLAQVEKLRHQVCRDLRILALMLAAEAPRAATDKQRREVARVNAEPLPECWWMRRHTDTFEVALCTTNLGGLLDDERPIGRWVYDFARRNDRLPTVQECQRHAAGQTVRVGV